MPYGSPEYIEDYGFIVPIAEFGQSHEDFLYRVNPFLSFQCTDVFDFANCYGYAFYEGNEISSAHLNDLPLDTSLGVLVKFRDSDYDDVDIEPFNEVTFSQALNAMPGNYSGHINMVVF